MNAPASAAPAKIAFTSYQKFVIGILAFLQFTLILDFMIMSPLGAILMPALHILPRQFGFAVSAYAFSAGLSGILAAGFADRFDRKKLLLFFYAGFTLGTFLCGIAPTYGFLLMARVVTGFFGGVIGSVVMAIIADLFPFQQRGRVMGVVQTAFAASQVLGLPLGLILANRWGWHAPFLFIVTATVVVGVIIVVKLEPLTGHLKAQAELDRHPLTHLFKTVSKGPYLQAFAATLFMATGGFMLMPFASAFSVNNLHITLRQLPKVYLATGIASFAMGPLLGRLSDKIGKYPMFILGSLLTMATVAVYCNLGVTPIQWVIVINIVLFAAITARMISSQALASAVPDLRDRGAFMAVNNSLAQLAGGTAAAIAGLIVVQEPGMPLGRYNVLGYVVMCATACTIALMYPINKMVLAKQKAAGAAAGGPGAGFGQGQGQPAAAAAAAAAAGAAGAGTAGKPN
jgi:predicted MFS family arabinose efflux permease